jgi:hypothetical protein
MGLSNNIKQQVKTDAVVEVKSDNLSKKQKLNQLLKKFTIKEDTS